MANDTAHSNCHQWLIFSKSNSAFETTGEIFYNDYLPSSEHPCPFPASTIKLLLDHYYQPGQTVLDPFMGIAVLGVEVLKRGGYFKGYEIDSSVFNKALIKLKNITQ